MLALPPIGSAPERVAFASHPLALIVPIIPVPLSRWTFGWRYSIVVTAVGNSQIASHSRRALGFAFALGLQALFIWALQTGFALRVAEVPESIQVTLIEQIRPEKEKLPQVLPKLIVPPALEVVVPEIAIDAPPEPFVTGITSPTALQSPQPTPSAALTILPRPDPLRPWAKPAFDKSASMILYLMVNATGKIIGARVVQSSGKRNLDAATIKEALQSWWLLPGTIDGKPVTMQVPWQVNFHVSNVQTEVNLPERPADAEVATRSAGDQRHCVSAVQIENMQVIDDKTIVAQTKANTYMRLDLGNCPGFALGNGISLNSSTGELCALDTVLTGRAVATPCTIEHIVNIEYAEAAALIAPPRTKTHTGPAH
jgi:TonB family protein